MVGVKLGPANAARTPKIEMTTSSSIAVKPKCLGDVTNGIGCVLRMEDGNDVCMP